MDIFNREECKALASIDASPCVSVYLRMFKKGRETRQNAIRFKNALGTVREALEGRPGDAERVRERLDAVGRLLDDGAFWRHQSRGLAFFVSPELSRVYRLPLEFDDFSIVAGRFHLKPVLPLISENLRFYLLALSQKSTRFYRCDRLHIDALSVENMPSNIEEALQYETERRQFQFYTGAPVQRGTTRRQAIFHGQGIAADEENDRLMRYCRMVDGAIYEILRNESAPLVLAGVEYLLAIFKQASAYPNLKEEGINGNPDQLDPDELHRSGWSIAADELAELKQQAVAKYHALKGTGLAAAEVTAIIRAACEGRIDRLVLGARRHVWGRYAENGRRVELFKDRAQAPDALDLLDVAACETIVKGGEVFTLPAEQMPDEASALAVFRF